MFLATSVAVFLVFFANVVMGAFWRNAFLSDVGEMLVLFTATVLFVIAILGREAERNRKKQD